MSSVMIGLDPDDTRPPYAQVVDTLRREIEQGVLAPGAKLPTHQELASQYGVSIGTVKRALGELQGAGLVLSRQGQGTFVRTRRTLLESVPHTISADTIAGLWATSYRFTWDGSIRHHADITRVTPQSSRRLVATNYPPDPRTKGHVPAFRNDIEAQIANRHVIGHWRNVSDSRYFGSLHLAVMPGEAVMHGYYTGFLTDIEVEAKAWRWVRIDPVTTSGVELAKVTLKEPEAIHGLVERSTAALPLSSILDRKR
jgi:DNA-binding transcriptional regulator YhcF (GntR family)